MGKLAIKQAELKKVQDKVDVLEKDLRETQARKKQLEEEVDDCTQKLERAQKLIGGLGGEKVRWSETAASLKDVYTNLTGDVLVSSGMIAYLGAFTAAFRTKISEDWVNICQENKVPSSERFSMRDVLGDPVKIRQWTI